MRGPDCPPRLELERVAAGEDVPTARAHVEGCAACGAAVAALRAEVDAFVRARPVDRFLAQVEAAGALPARPRRAPVVAMVAVCAAAVTALVAWPPGPGPRVRVKGPRAPFQVIHLKRAGVVRALAAGDALVAGDALRFSVSVDQPGFALGLDRDARGKVTAVAPFGAERPQAIDEGTTVLDDSAVIDDAPGPETFVTVFSPVPFEVAPLLRQLEVGGRPSCERCVVEEASFGKR
ncbi:MAG: hypothetical protein INH37_24235 [Myxococcaceae bacterium]|nr:hypothetical protein [Myxococcaceae bacterium]